MGSEDRWSEGVGVQCHAFPVTTERKVSDQPLTQQSFAMADAAGVAND